MTNLLTSCADDLNYSLRAIFSSNSIINSSEEAVAASNPFSPNLGLDGEVEYESIMDQTLVLVILYLVTRLF